MIVRNVLFYILFLSLLTTSGCWDARELNEISIVTGMAIDKGENHKFKLTAEFLNVDALSPETPGQQAASVIFSQEGNSIADLAKRMNIGPTRKLIYSHMRVVVLSKEVAQEGMLEFLDFMERDREIRNDFNFLVADNVAASDVLKITYPIQRVSSLKLNIQLDTMVEEWGGDPDIRIKKFIKALQTSGREPISALVRIEGSVEEGKHVENMQQTEPKAWVILEGIAVFKGLEYQGNLNVTDTRNYLWTQDGIRKTSATVSCGIEEDEPKYTTARIYNSKTDIKTKYEENVPHIEININFEGRMDGNQCKEDFSKLETILHYEQLYERGIEKNVLNTIKKVQKDFGVDIFGFGHKMERQNYNEWQRVKDQWNKEFQKAVVTVKVNAKIRRTGLKTESFLNDLAPTD